MLNTNNMNILISRVNEYYKINSYSNVASKLMDEYFIVDDITNYLAENPIDNILIPANNEEILEILISVLERYHENREDYTLVNTFVGDYSRIKDITIKFVEEISGG